MFAVVKTGGKQYKVAENDILKLEKLEGEVGAKISLDNVLLVQDDKKGVVTDPKSLASISVNAEILEQKKDSKVIIFKKKRRKNYRRKNGHRQQVTVVKILNITSGSATKTAAAPTKEAAPKKAADTAEKKETQTKEDK